MRTILKWIGRILAILVGLIVIAFVAVYLISESRLNATYDVTPADIEVPDDEESIARGEHLATSIADCTGCHGEDLGGTIMVDDPVVGRLAASNLTSGEGGIGGTYTDEDWVRAIRHAVAPDGSVLIYMPSHEYNQLGEEDIAAIIAYVKTAPPVDNVLPENSAGPLARVLFVTGQMTLVPAELIDHDAPPPRAVEPGVTVAYGEYLTTGCRGCHRADLTGGPIPGAPPDIPPAANLTPHESGLAGWSEEDFFRAMREGERPDGSAINEFMPWMTYSNMTNDELSAMWMFLEMLEPLPAGS